MKIVLTGCICETDEQKKEIAESFNKEFGCDGIIVLGSYNTLPGHGGEGGRSDVVVEMPDAVVGRAATHIWHLSGMFRWYDDYLSSSRDIIPPEALKEFYGEVSKKELASHNSKPKCQLVGIDSNVYVLAGRVRVCLLRAGMREKAKEFTEKLHECHSYDEAISLMMEYVDAY